MAWALELFPNEIHPILGSNIIAFAFEYQAWLKCKILNQNIVQNFSLIVLFLGLSIVNVAPGLYLNATLVFGYWWDKVKFSESSL
jgi:hypothetical protein